MNRFSPSRLSQLAQGVGECTPSEPLTLTPIDDSEFDINLMVMSLD